MNRIATAALFVTALTASSGCTAEDRLQPAANKSGATTMIADYRTLPLETITGDTTNLQSFAGKAVLIVNVASECGNTPQYADLERLYRAYKDSGLVIIGFPANNFGGQEPGTNLEILEFCTTKFKVSFPMMAKVSVKGDDKHALFTYLTEQSSQPGEIKWNFSKFLLNRQGNLVARFDPKTDPMGEEITSAVKNALATPE